MGPRQPYRNFQCQHSNILTQGSCPNHSTIPYPVDATVSCPSSSIISCPNNSNGSCPKDSMVSVSMKYKKHTFLRRIMKPPHHSFPPNHLVLAFRNHLWSSRHLQPFLPFTTDPNISLTKHHDEVPCHHHPPYLLRSHDHRR